MADRKKKESAAGIFFGMFLRAMVVILAFVIVALAVFLGRKIITGAGRTAPTTQPDESILTDGDIDELLTATPTEMVTESPYSIADSDIDFSIGINCLNATDTSGLAGHWRDKLNELGYTNVTAANSYTLYEETRIVVTEEGVARELASLFPGAAVEVGEVGNDVMDGPVDGVKVFIFLGNSSDELSE